MSELDFTETATRLVTADMARAGAAALLGYGEGWSDEEAFARGAFVAMLRAADEGARKELLGLFFNVTSGYEAVANPRKG